MLSKKKFFQLFHHHHYTHLWWVHSTLHCIRIKLALNRKGKVSTKEGAIIDGALSLEEQRKLEDEEHKLFESLKVEEEQGRRAIRTEQECIHFVKDASSCKHCCQANELQIQAEQGTLKPKEQVQYQKKKLHKALAQAQHGSMLLIKMMLEEGKAKKGTILVMQDFTQLVTTKGGFTQDLVIVWYQYDDEKAGLVQHTHHFVAGELEKRGKEKKNEDREEKKGKWYKADVGFVIAVWEELLETEWASVTSIIVFSDGCSRQFKSTRYSIYLM